MSPTTERRAAALLILAFAGLIGWSLRPPPPPDLAALAALRATFEARVDRLWATDGLRRADGCVYTVDVGHLLIHTAQRGDHARYAPIAAAARALVRDDPSDPYTRGFVPWRSCRGAPPDASGTTEALRIARGLWLGAAAFDQPADRALARVVLDGYRGHATTEFGVWMVRNYFDLGTRAFANDSYLVDYDPDFVAEVARETGDPALADLAARSAARVRSAVAPSGLIHTLVQPDVATIMPDAPVPVFSPNDVIQLNNACAVAETVARTDPAVARGLLDFAVARGRHLPRAAYGRTGEPVDAARADSTTWSCLVRLATAVGDRETRAQLLPRAVWAWRWLADDPTPRPYATIEALLALDAVLAMP